MGLKVFVQIFDIPYYKIKLEKFGEIGKLFRFNFVVSNDSEILIINYDLNCFAGNVPNWSFKQDIIWTLGYI